MESGCKFQIERTIVFRRHILAVHFFAHFDIGDRIVTRFKIFDFGSGIVGIVVHHGNRDNRGQALGDAALEKQVES